jgi:acetyl esterase/lipase
MSNINNLFPINRTFINVAYGHIINQKFDIVIPKQREAHVIVYIHGGAYLTGNKLQYPSFLAEYIKNTVVASIDYRVLDNNNHIHMDDILSDIINALNKIIELTNFNDTKIKNIILIGHSAGGHIGLLYAYKYFQDNIKINACISLAGPTDFTDDLGWSSMTMWGNNLGERLSFLSQMGSKLTGHEISLKQMNWSKQRNYSEFKKHIEEISPIIYISKEKRIPPTLLVHARADDQVPYSNSIRLKRKLDLFGVPNKLITPAGTANSHMLGGEIDSYDAPLIFENQTWVNEANKWLETYLQ